MPDGNREEAINVWLAELLKRGGADAKAERIIHAGGKKSYPDVRATWSGLRVVIEAKYEAPGAAAEVEAQVAERLENALGEVGIALLYPAELRGADDVEANLRDARLRARFSAPGRPGSWQDFDGVEDLLRCFDHARALLIDDDAVSEAADLLDGAIKTFEGAVQGQPGRRDALLPIVSASDATAAGAKELEKARKAATAIAGLAVCTAAMLQAELSKVDAAVPSLPAAESDTLRQDLLKSWQKVLDHDYAAIFRVALDTLSALADDETLDVALKRVIELAGEVSKNRTLARHDLIGRVYHTLLADQKFLATYFTSVPAATLLSYLALDAERWPEVDWGRDPEEGPPIRVGDFASGTGTLLLAVFDAVRQEWAAARAAKGQAVDLPAFGEAMIEEGIQGYDVLAYALQVCASTLLLASGGAVIERTGLHRMPFGGEAGRLGSLELLAGQTTAQLWGDESGSGVTLEGSDGLTKITFPHEQLDLAIMNPPFTRSVGGSRLLGSLDGPAFEEARNRLRELVGRDDVAATLTAGLGAPFVELGSRAVRPSGRLALVLPKTVLTGDAWRRTRELLAERFHLEYVITSHEADRWNFSDSTDLSEALLLARKYEKDEEGESGQGLETTWVALRSNPATSIEALGTLSAIRRAEPAVEGGKQLTTGDVLDRDVGEMFSRPAPMDGRPWREGTFSRSVLNAAAGALLRGEPVPLPRASRPLEIPLRALDTNNATIGYDRRDVTDAFELVGTSQAYPAFWGQDAGEMRTLAQEPNRELAPRTSPAPGRSRVKDAAQVWAGAGMLMISERLRATTYRTTAVVLDQRALSNTSWSVNLYGDDPEAYAFVALWLNSTLGLLSYIAASEETEGPWMAMKKRSLTGLRVLDPSALSGTAREILRDAWAELQEQELGAVADLARDPARQRIDHALCEALGLPEDAIDALRGLLGSEPRFARAEPKRRTLAEDIPAQRPLF